MRSRGVLVNREEVDAPLRQLCLPHQPKRTGRGINLLAATSNSNVTGKHIMLNLNAGFFLDVRKKLKAKKLKTQGKNSKLKPQAQKVDLF